MDKTGCMSRSGIGPGSLHVVDQPVHVGVGGQAGGHVCHHGGRGR